MKVTPAGQFLTVVRFMGPPEAPDVPTDPKTGEKVWADGAYGRVHIMRAKVKTLASREQIRARQVNNDTTHVFTIRYTREVDTRMRIFWRDGRRNHVAHVTGIVETVRGRELEVSATETAYQINYDEVFK